MARSPREEIVCVTTTTGRLDVVGGEFDTALMIDGRPFALVWPDEEGSVGQHLIRSAGVDLREAFQAVRPLLDRGLNEDAGVIAAAGPFLGVVAPGPYRVRFEPRVDEWFGFHQLEAGSSRATKCRDFYPSSCELVATLPQENLDRDRVDHFRKAIEIGKRPVVVALAADEAWVGFVVDGHHKLTAYHELRVPPALLSLVRQAPKVVEELLHTEFGQHSMWADYAGKRSRRFGPEGTCGVPLGIFEEIEAAAVTLAKRLGKDVPHTAILRAALARALSEKSGYDGFVEGIITEQETVSLICAHLLDALGVAEQGGQGGGPFDSMAEVLLKAVRRWRRTGK